ncbi:MAG: hypothetical protein QM644_08890 [Mobilitalea sp.]
MNITFGLPVKKEVTLRRSGATESTAQYEKKLSEYRETLENYRRTMMEYTSKLEGYDRRTIDNQLSVVQTALDMTFLKEQGDKITELIAEMNSDTSAKDKLEVLEKGLEALVRSFGELNKNVESLDTNVVNRINELQLELQRQTLYQNKMMQTELLNSLENLDKRVRRGHGLLWFIVIFNIFGICAMTLAILFYLDLLPFRL